MPSGGISDFTGARTRPVNYINICRNIADEYPFGTGHGVQKDAIQNSVDARAGASPVCVDFELLQGSKLYLCITDRNTTGLGGPIFEDESHYDADLPEDCNWARFESFAFHKDSPDALGARGQGKFIFLNASALHMIYYDTRLPSGEYRAGATQATRNGCPILRWVGKEAQTQIQGRLKLEPISHVGTRIIVVEPTLEICQFVRSDALVEAVQETWFRLLEAETLHVSVAFDNKRQEVGLPSFMPLANVDDDDHASWILGDDFSANTIQVSPGQKYKVRAFRAMLLRTEQIPEAFRGIAVIHNGMKIECVRPPSLFPEDLADRIVGFIEFDRDLDRELRKGENQKPNHYELHWRKRLPKAIKDYINSQMDAFGRRKLGLGPATSDARERRRESAVEAAMHELLRYAGDMDLFGAKGHRQPSNPVPPLSPLKDVGIHLCDFCFPDPLLAPRVNRGMSFTNIRALAFNKTDKALQVALSILVLRGDKAVLEIHRRHQFELGSRKKAMLRPFSIDVKGRPFSQAGLYRLRASLFEVSTGNRLDEVTRQFWVEADPPLKRPFDVKHVQLPHPYDHRQWMAEGSPNNSPVLHVNTSHPAYKAAEEREELKEYLFDVMLEGVVCFFFERADPDSGLPDYHPLRAASIFGGRADPPAAGIPRKAYEEVCDYLSRVRWRMYGGR